MESLIAEALAIDATTTMAPGSMVPMEEIVVEASRIP